MAGLVVSLVVAGRLAVYSPARNHTAAFRAGLHLARAALFHAAYGPGANRAGKLQNAHHSFGIVAKRRSRRPNGRPFRAPLAG